MASQCSPSRSLSRLSPIASFTSAVIPTSTAAAAGNRRRASLRSQGHAKSGSGSRSNSNPRGVLSADIWLSPNRSAAADSIPATATARAAAAAASAFMARSTSTTSSGRSATAAAGSLTGERFDVTASRSGSGSPQDTSAAPTLADSCTDCPIPSDAGVSVDTLLPPSMSAVPFDFTSASVLTVVDTTRGSDGLQVGAGKASEMAADDVDLLDELLKERDPSTSIDGPLSLRSKSEGVSGERNSETPVTTVPANHLSVSTAWRRMSALSAHTTRRRSITFESAREPAEMECDDANKDGEARHSKLMHARPRLASRTNSLSVNDGAAPISSLPSHNAAHGNHPYLTACRWACDSLSTASARKDEQAAAGEAAALPASVPASSGKVLVWPKHGRSRSGPAVARNAPSQMPQASRERRFIPILSSVSEDAVEGRDKKGPPQCQQPRSARQPASCCRTLEPAATTTSTVAAPTATATAAAVATVPSVASTAYRSPDSEPAAVSQEVDRQCAQGCAALLQLPVAFGCRCTANLHPLKADTDAEAQAEGAPDFAAREMQAAVAAAAEATSAADLTLAVPGALLNLLLPDSSAGVASGRHQHEHAMGGEGKVTSSSTQASANPPGQQQRSAASTVSRLLLGDSTLPAAAGIDDAPPGLLKFFRSLATTATTQNKEGAADQDMSALAPASLSLPVAAFVNDGNGDNGRHRHQSVNALSKPVMSSLPCNNISNQSVERLKAVLETPVFSESSAPNPVLPPSVGFPSNTAGATSPFRPTTGEGSQVSSAKRGSTAVAPLSRGSLPPPSMSVLRVGKTGPQSLPAGDGPTARREESATRAAIRRVSGHVAQMASDFPTCGAGPTEAAASSALAHASELHTSVQGPYASQLFDLLLTDEELSFPQKGNGVSYDACKHGGQNFGAPDSHVTLSLLSATDDPQQREAFLMMERRLSAKSESAMASPSPASPCGGKLPFILLPKAVGSKKAQVARSGRVKSKTSAGASAAAAVTARASRRQARSPSEPRANHKKVRGGPADPSDRRASFHALAGLGPKPLRRHLTGLASWNPKCCQGGRRQRREAASAAGDGVACSSPDGTKAGDTTAAEHGKTQQSAPPCRRPQQFVSPLSAGADATASARSPCSRKKTPMYMGEAELSIPSSPFGRYVDAEHDSALNEGNLSTFGVNTTLQSVSEGRTGKTSYRDDTFSCGSFSRPLGDGYAGSCAPFGVGMNEDSRFSLTTLPSELMNGVPVAAAAGVFECPTPPARAAPEPEPGKSPLPSPTKQQRPSEHSASLSSINLGTSCRHGSDGAVEWSSKRGSGQKVAVSGLLPVIEAAAASAGGASRSPSLGSKCGGGSAASVRDDCSLHGKRNSSGRRTPSHARAAAAAVGAIPPLPQKSSPQRSRSVDDKSQLKGQCEAPTTPENSLAAPPAGFPSSSAGDGPALPVFDDVGSQSLTALSQPSPRLPPPAIPPPPPECEALVPIRRLLCPRAESSRGAVAIITGGVAVRGATRPEFDAQLCRVVTAEREGSQRGSEVDGISPPKLFAWAAHEASEGGVPLSLSSLPETVASLMDGSPSAPLGSSAGGCEGGIRFFTHLPSASGCLSRGSVAVPAPPPFTARRSTSSNGNANANAVSAVNSTTQPCCYSSLSNMDASLSAGAGGVQFSQTTWQTSYTTAISGASYSLSVGGGGGRHGGPSGSAPQQLSFSSSTGIKGIRFSPITRLDRSRTLQLQQQQQQQSCQRQRDIVSRQQRLPPFAGEVEEYGYANAMTEATPDRVPARCSNGGTVAGLFSCRTAPANLNSLSSGNRLLPNGKRRSNKSNHKTRNDPVSVLFQIDAPWLYTDAEESSEASSTLFSPDLLRVSRPRTPCEEMVTDDASPASPLQ